MRTTVVSLIALALSTIACGPELIASSSTDAAGDGDGDDDSAEPGDGDGDGLEADLPDDMMPLPDMGTDETGDGDGDGDPLEDTGACCYCLDGGTWECLPWSDAQSCIDWGYAESLTVSWIPYCPEAYTRDTDDDVACAASCA